MSISSDSAVTNSQSNLSAAAMIKAAIQEANETTTATRIEAARGDQQAIRKLAKQQQQQMQSQNPTPKPELGVGEAVDHQA